MARTNAQGPRRCLDWGLIVEDVAVWAYLASDVRPEKGLKPLALVKGVARYDEAGFQQFADVNDPELATYNVKDAVAPLLLRYDLRAECRARYRCSPKPAVDTQRWYSDLIWLAVHLIEAGCALDESRLDALADELVAARDQASAAAGADYSLRLGNGGVTNAVRDFVVDQLKAGGLLTHPELKRSRQTGAVSAGLENLNLLLGAMPAGDNRDRRILDLIIEHRQTCKLLSTYVRPLIGKPDGFPARKEAPKGPDLSQRLIDGVAFPTWYPCPMEDGGTKQARFTCSKPGLQTLPRDTIKPCLTSRHRPGFLLSTDLSQAEPVTGAVISGDPVALDEFDRDLDGHTIQAIAIFGADVSPLLTAEPRTTVVVKARIAGDSRAKQQRQVGKIVRLSTQYRGGAWQLRGTLRREMGLEYELDRCEAMVAYIKSHYAHYFAWQDELIARVSRDGYLYDPILGQGRLFTKSLAANLRTYEATICNFLIQSVAANLMLAAQVGVAQKLSDRMLARTVLNVYDSVAIDGPLSELPAVQSLVDESLTTNTYRSRVEDTYGRSIPLRWETDVYTYEQE
jgi:hypothetical protein